MDTINLQEAQTKLAQLVARAVDGEEIIIAKAERPLGRLVPLEKRGALREFGFMAGQVLVGLDFDKPVSAEMMTAFASNAP